MRNRFFCVITFSILNFSSLSFASHQPRYEITKISYYDDGICSLRYQHESNTERGLLITNNDLLHILGICQNNNAQAVTFSTQYQTNPIENFYITSNLLYKNDAPEEFFNKIAVKQSAKINDITPILNETSQTTTSWVKMLVGLGCGCAIVVIALYTLYGNEFFTFILG